MVNAYRMLKMTDSQLCLPPGIIGEINKKELKMHQRRTLTVHSFAWLIHLIQYGPLTDGQTQAQSMLPR